MKYRSSLRGAGQHEGLLGPADVFRFSAAPLQEAGHRQLARLRILEKWSLCKFVTSDLLVRVLRPVQFLKKVAAE